MRRLGIFVLSLMCLAIGSRNVQAEFGTNWTAVFFNNTTFSGVPTAIISDINGVNFNWPDIPSIAGVPVVGIGADSFSARFISTQNFTQGTYQFTITYDDNARVNIDGNEVFNDFTGGPVKTRTFNRNMTTGPHTMQVDFVEISAAAVIQLQWSLTLAGPLLIAPSNAVLIEDTTPTFSWSAVPSATEYHIQIGNDINFINPEIEHTLTNRQYTPGNPLELGVYYWRVRANNSAWSGVRQFTIDLLRPRLNYFATSDVLLTWNPISWAESYTVQISRNLVFTDLVETIPSSDIFVEYTLSNGTYYWRVRALATDQTGKWSAPELITVEMP